MADTAARRPELASLRRSRRLPVIWAVPIVAIAIGAWLAWDTLSKQGPRIVVSFQDAEGLQIGQSQLKFKDIALGTVQGLEFTPDHRRGLHGGGACLFGAAGRCDRERREREGRDDVALHGQVRSRPM